MGSFLCINHRKDNTLPENLRRCIRLFYILGYKKYILKTAVNTGIKVKKIKGLLLRHYSILSIFLKDIV